MLLRIHDEKSSNPLKVGISDSIGQISTFFWKVKDQKKAETNLYELFKKQPNDAVLKKNLDNALMKAKGLYWDAIHDYNDGGLSNAFVKKTVAKFKRVFTEFPESIYASKAHYYLAKYYTRVYLKRKDSKDNRLLALADKNELIAKDANSTYQNYFKMVKDGNYNYNDEMEARYYFALNLVLLGKLDNAIRELEKIRNSPIRDKFPIYVYEFYYSKDNGNALKQYFPPEQLANYTIEYLRTHPKYSDNYKEAFEEYLNNFKPEE